MSQTKLAQAEVALKKATEYVATTQPLLDEYNENKEQFAKKAHQVVGVLVNRGIVQRNKSNTLIDKLAADHSYAFDVIEGMVDMVTPSRLGESSDIKFASSSSLDPYERLAITGDVNGKVVNSGIVD